MFKEYRQVIYRCFSCGYEERVWQIMVKSRARVIEVHRPSR